ncbi:OPT/YSL family transporter [Providencia sp. PROV092]|uniref:OPT/YSL family transporter n=1 Tax=Providencia sp. PROV092 TaxID=2949808 RepID=UPI00234B7C6A|nr:OPT/YSL family transporter [Providencia sp. PROV092]
MNISHDKNDTEVRVSIFSPALLIAIIILSFVGAIIGIQIIVTLGISANTSIIGAVLAILLSRVPLSIFASFKFIDAQNLIQTSISAATFAAANGLIVAIGVPWVLGMPELIYPMMAGAFVAIIIDGTILYGLFNTRAYPASASWPAGVATAETLWAGNKGGKRLGALLTGFAAGAIGAGFGIPMASAGIALIGSIFALFMFAVGLLIRGFSESGLITYNLYENYVPHGVMIGAGIVALIQIGAIVFRNKKDSQQQSEDSDELRQSSKRIKSTLIKGATFYFLTALALTFISQIFVTMTLPQLIGFLIFATLAALTQEMIVGMAAMHSGWFPATAAALISLMIGILLGFPPEVLAVLVGFCAATGPAFADMGFDLKTGFMIRGYGKNQSAEHYGRKQQYFAAIIGFCCALVVVALTYDFYFEQDKIVPASRLYAATIQAGSSSDVAMMLLLWAIPGAIIQLIGGAKNQIGVLFSTGLMINYPIAGWTVLTALAVRIIIERFFNISSDKISTFAGGLIAGDALYSTAKAFLPTLKAKLLSFWAK